MGRFITVLVVIAVLMCTFAAGVVIAKPDVVNELLAEASQARKDFGQMLVGDTPTPTETPVPTNTPLPTPTPRPTATPIPPKYETEQFIVNARSAYVFTLTGIEKGMRVQGYFLIQGGGNDVGFRILAPSGNYLANENRVYTRHSFDFRAPEEGAYVFTFVNTFSWLTAKSVTFSYRAW